MDITYQGVFNALSFHAAKTAGEVAEEIAAAHDIPYKDKYLRQSYPFLHQLVAEGFASDRERQLSLEQLEKRGGRPSYEYLLTQDGMRKRAEVPEGGLEGVLVPEPI